MVWCNVTKENLASAMQKRLNRSSCCFRWWMGCYQGIVYWIDVHLGTTWQIWLNSYARRLWVGLPPAAVTQFVLKLLWSVMLTFKTCLSHVPYGITQCYLPDCHPAEVTFPPLPHPIKAGTRFSDPRGMQGWVDLVGLVTYQGDIPAGRRSPIPILTGLNVEQLRTTNDATTALNRQPKG